MDGPTSLVTAHVVVEFRSRLTAESVGDVGCSRCGSALMRTAWARRGTRHCNERDSDATESEGPDGLPSPSPEITVSPPQPRQSSQQPALEEAKESAANVARHELDRAF